MKRIRAIKINIIFVIVIVFIFLCITAKLIYIGTGNVMVKGKTLASFASDRDTVKRTLKAPRGTIYSSEGEVLAKDVNSYTVIAYLEPSRTKDENHPYHVVNKELTAEKLSPIINMSKEKILEILNTKIKTCDENNLCKESIPYQVELGPGGRGITELVKDQIEELDLPGIDFLSSTKRYYPNGDFLSYELGYAKTDDNGTYKGEMGIERYYNKELTGEDGYIEYQSDLYGYQITSMPSVEKKAVAGNDIYLTIDTNIQMFAEQAKTTLEKAKPQWATVAVVNAKTGEILGVSSSPSFNNNTLEIKSYYSPFVQNTYEPGSTMKIFSFMAAMQNGVYDGDEKYQSGRLKVDDAVIKDWNGYGWGKITYDEGFMGSSNVAASHLALDKLGRAKLKDFYNLLGFGKKTGIYPELKDVDTEGTGLVNFRYNTEVASASYGQGISVTAIQMLQALTTLGNKGTMLKPYIISKIVDSEGNIVLENKRTEVSKVCSEEVATKIIDLMRGVVDGRSSISTGTGYKIKGYDLVGKTGTAEIASSSGGYLTGSTNYVRSFAGLFPGKDPEIIVYVAAAKMNNSSYLKTAVKDLVKNVGTYLNIYGDVSDEEDTTYTLKSYVSKKTEDVKNELKDSGLKSIIIGDGENIIKQYPEENVILNKNSKVFLLTNSNKYKMVDIKDWSRNDVLSYAKLINLNVVFNGFGYVKEYSINKNSEIDLSKTLEVTLEPKYKLEEETDEDKKDGNKNE